MGRKSLGTWIFAGILFIQLVGLSTLFADNSDISRGLIKVGINFTENGKTVSAPRIIQLEATTAVIRMTKGMYFPERWLPPVIKDNKNEEASPELSKTPTDIGLRFEITPTVCSNMVKGKEVKGVFLNCRAVVSNCNSSKEFSVNTIDFSTSVFPVFVPFAELNTPVKIPLKCFKKQYEAEISVEILNPDGTPKSLKSGN